MSTSQSVAQAVRREIMACMETGNVDRARTVLAEYQQTCRDSTSLEDMSADLRVDVVDSYGVAL
jgi:predicted dehydrogenase